MRDGRMHPDAAAEILGVILRANKDFCKQGRAI